MSEYQSHQTEEIILQLFSLNFHNRGTNRTSLIAVQCMQWYDQLQREKDKKREEKLIVE